MNRRIQRRRTRGWKMPEGAVYVGRPTMWGNPFKVGAISPCGTKVADLRHAFVLYRTFAPMQANLVAAARAELRGKTLVCWCPESMYPEDGCCHADVLLAIANSDGDAVPHD